MGGIEDHWSKAKFGWYPYRLHGYDTSYNINMNQKLTCSIDDMLWKVIVVKRNM